MKLVFIVVALGLIGFGVWLLVQKLECKTKIEGKFIRSEQLASRGIGTITPVFRYQFASDEYECASMDSFCGKCNENRFVEGESYSIYVNEKKPSRFVLTRKIQLDDISLVLMGFIFVLFLYLRAFVL